MQRSLEGCERWGAGSIIFRSLSGPVERYHICPWRPEYGPEGEHFVSGLFFYFGGCSEDAMDRGRARSAPFGVAMSSKRRVRAAHGRARAAKTH